MSRPADAFAKRPVVLDALDNGALMQQHVIDEFALRKRWPGGAGHDPTVDTLNGPGLSTGRGRAGRSGAARRAFGQPVSGPVRLWHRAALLEALRAPRIDAKGESGDAVARMPYNSIIRSLKERSKVAHL
jgi:hypothetical protein